MAEVSSWSSYIQINIYGKKLRELQHDGIDVAQFLRDVGCGKFWMSEVPMMSSDSDSGLDSSGEEDVERVETTQMIDGTGPLSTTVADVKFPRCSTPIVSKRWPSFNMLPSGMSNIYYMKGDESEHLSDVEDAESDEIEQHVREALEDILEKLIVPSLSPIETYRSECIPSLVCSKAELPSTVPASLLPGASCSSALVASRKSQSRVEKKCVGPNVMKRKSRDLLNVISDEPPVYHQLCNTQLRTDDDLYFSNHFSQLQRRLSSFYESAVVDHTFDLDVEKDARIENYEEDDDEGRLLTPLSPAISRISKRVSFAVPETRHEKKMNKSHVVKCHFEGCTKSFVWKPKYGKTRLVDHAFTHLSGQEFKCALCEFTCRTIRSIRYHHKHKHDDVQLTGFGIRSILKSSKNDTDFVKVWDTCYKDNLKLLENKTINLFTVQKKRREKKKPGDEENVEKNPEREEDEPTFRIR